jgi:hypothetical protein
LFFLSFFLCSGKPDPNAKPNLNAVIQGTPTFVRSVPNGQLWTVGDAAQNITVPIVHLFGTPYQKGFARGTLMKQQIQGLGKAVWAYLEEQVEEALNGTLGPIPVEIAQWIANVGLDAALDATYELTKNFTGQVGRLTAVSAAVTDLFCTCPRSVFLGRNEGHVRRLGPEL